MVKNEEKWLEYKYQNAYINLLLYFLSESGKSYYIKI